MTGAGGLNGAGNCMGSGKTDWTTPIPCVVGEKECLGGVPATCGASKTWTIGAPCAAGLCSEGACVAATSPFVDLGLPVDGAGSSASMSVSADGSVIVGNTGLDPIARPFRWTAATGVVRLPTVPGHMDGNASSVSADGLTVVGGGGPWDDAEDAFAWTEAAGVTTLGKPDCLGASRATTVSHDGKVVAGYVVPSATKAAVAVKWENGAATSLGLLPTAASSFVNAGSTDGNVFVGKSGDQGFRWTAATGMVSVGTLASGGKYSEAFGVSADGTTVVGTTATEAYRWTQATGIVGIGMLDSDANAYAEAYAASGDGSVVVGMSSGLMGYRAFVWDAAHGMRDVRAVLAAAGVDMGTWQLQAVTGVSADGKVLVGYGATDAAALQAGRLRAFRVILP